MALVPHWKTDASESMLVKAASALSHAESLPAALDCALTAMFRFFDASLPRELGHAQHPVASGQSSPFVDTAVLG